MTKAPTRALRAASPIGVTASWRDLPYQTVANAARIGGCSPAKIYAYLHFGDLRAVKLGGKTLIETGSLVALLSRATRWQSDRIRVAAANKRRLEVLNR